MFNIQSINHKGAKSDQNIDRRTFIKGLGTLFVVGAGSKAGTDLFISYFEDQRQKDYLIKGKYCNSKSESFTPLSEFDPVRFYENYPYFNGKEPIGIVNTSDPYYSSTLLFDKYGSPDNYIKKVVKELTGMDTSVEVIIDNTISDNTRAFFDEIHQVIKIRSYSFYDGYIQEKGKQSDYGFITRLLTLAHEMGHALNTLAEKNKNNQLDEFYKKIKNDLNENEEELAGYDKESREIDYTINNIIKPQVIYDETISFLFSLCVGDFFISKYPEFKTFVKNLIFSTDNCKMLYINAYQENKYEGKDYLSVYSDLADDEHYNGALMAYALIEFYGNPEKAFNAFTVNDKILPEVNRIFLENYHYIQESNKRIPSLYYNDYFEDPVSNTKDFITSLKKYTILLAYLGYKRDEKVAELNKIVELYSKQIKDDKIKLNDTLQEYKHILCLLRCPYEMIENIIKTVVENCGLRFDPKKLLAN